MNSLFLALVIGFGLIRSDYGPLPQVSSSTKSTFLTKKDSTQRMSIDGLYISNANSFRNNFYIKVKGDTVTLFGWQTGINNDTVYYKSRTVNTSKEEGWVIWHFERHEFSSEPIMNDTIEGLKVDRNIRPFTGTLHNYFLGTYAEGLFKLIATTNIYDSRADVFEFVKVE